MPSTLVELTCPSCRVTRQVTKQVARVRKSDKCQKCYRQAPYAGGPKPIVPKTKPKSVTEATLDALAKTAAGVPAVEAAAQAQISLSDLWLAAKQVEDLAPLAEKVKAYQADKLYVLAQILLDSIDSTSVEQLDAKERIVAAAKAIDTARILEGKPTEIVAQFKAVMEKYVIQVEAGPGVVEYAEQPPKLKSLGREEIVDVKHQVIQESRSDGVVPGSDAPDVLQQYRHSGEQGSGDQGGGSEAAGDAGTDGASAVSVRDQVWPYSRRTSVPDGSVDRSVAGNGQ